MKNYKVTGRMGGGTLAPLRNPIYSNLYKVYNVYGAGQDFLHPLIWFRVDMGASTGTDAWSGFLQGLFGISAQRAPGGR